VTTSCCCILDLLCSYSRLVVMKMTYNSVFHVDTCNTVLLKCIVYQNDCSNTPVGHRRDSECVDEHNIILYFLYYILTIIFSFFIIFIYSILLFNS
jgi:hypothetical protein